jgi:chaperonin GroES
MREIVPTGDRLIVKRAAPLEFTAGGLTIPTSAQEQPQEAKVFKVGPDVRDIYEDDTVLVGKYAGIQIEFAGKEFLLIRENEVVAKIYE